MVRCFYQTHRQHCKTDQERILNSNLGRMWWLIFSRHQKLYLMPGNPGHVSSACVAESKEDESKKLIKCAMTKLMLASSRLNMLEIIRMLMRTTSGGGVTLILSGWCWRVTPQPDWDRLWLQLWCDAAGPTPTTSRDGRHGSSLLSFISNNYVCLLHSVYNSNTRY